MVPGYMVRRDFYENGQTYVNQKHNWPGYGLLFSALPRPAMSEIAPVWLTAYGREVWHVKMEAADTAALERFAFETLHRA